MSTSGDAPAPKRICLDILPSNTNPWANWISQQPTATLLVFDVPITHSASDVYAVFSHYGDVKAVERSADGIATLVAMPDSLCTQAVVQSATVDSIVMGTQRLIIKYSSQQLLYGTEALRFAKVVRFQISDAIQPITTDLLYSTCAPYASALRIHIGPRKVDNVVDALVEFASPHEVNEIIQKLQNRDIYLGSCQMQLTLSGFPCVLIGRQNVRARDFTVTPAHVKLDVSSSPVVSLNNSIQTPSVCTNPILNTIVGLANINSGFLSSHPYHLSDSYSDTSTLAPSSVSHGAAGRNAFCEFVEMEGCVVYFNHLPDALLNCDRLFNLVSLYGNVVRIKFILSREGVAMVQMSTPQAGEHVLIYLNRLTVFDSTITVIACKHPNIGESASSQLLKDGSPSLKSFYANQNNRFLAPTNSTRTRIMPPTSTLHFFNAPPNLDEATMRSIIANNNGHDPQKVAIFPSKSGQSGSLGLIEWSSVRKAVETLIFVNNVVVKPDSAPHPYHFKLAFSSKPIRESR